MAGGVVLVVGIGLVASAMLPRTTDLLTNPQIAGRTSPTLVDMVAAVATGLVLVMIPLLANSVATTLIALWTQRVSDAAQAWVGQVPDGVQIMVDTSVGRQIDAGVVGEPPSTSG